VEPGYVVRLMDLGILVLKGEDRFSPGDVRRVQMAKSLEDAGIPLPDVATAIQRGALSLDFLDAASFERVAHLAPESFQQVSVRTGIPLELLTVIREAVGMAPPSLRGTRGAGVGMVATLAVVGVPARASRSLTAIGTPCSGPRYAPAAISRSARTAAARARSAKTS